MKTYRYILAVLVVAIASGTIFFACKKDPHMIRKSTLEQNDPSYWGTIHNLFLINFNETFDENNTEVFDAEFTEEIIDYMHSINQDYLIVLHESDIINEIDVWSEELEKTKYYACTPYLYYVLQTEGAEIHERLNNLAASAVIDELECEILQGIMTNVKQNLAGEITQSDFLEYIHEANAIYTANYDESSEHGKMLQIILSIANASAEYWTERTDLLDPYAIWEEYHPHSIEPHSPCYAVPAAVAADVGGAIVGGTVSAVSSYAQNGEVNWKGVGISAATGAVSASVGAAVKVGTAVCKVAVKLGKWIASKF